MRQNSIENYAVLPKDVHQAYVEAVHQLKEEPVLKQKISIVLVFAIIAVLLAGIAYAAISLRGMGRQVVETEQTEGYYGQWSIASKTTLVCSLADLGYIEETTHVKQLIAGTLPEAEAHRAADDALIAFTGLEVSEISFMEIMDAAWGPFTQWSKEEQAWYSELMVDMGLQGEDHTLYMRPEGPVDEAQAIAIALREIAKGYEVEENALSSFIITTSFQVPEFAAPGDKQAYWYVELSAPDTMPNQERLFGMFWVFIHPETGELLQSMESLLAERAEWANEETRRNAYWSHPVYVADIKLATQANDVFWNRTLEQKAEYSQKVKPWIQAILDSGDLSALTYDGQVDNDLLAAATYTYGLPGEQDIPQKQALDLAFKAIRGAYGLDDKTLSQYGWICTSFDITYPDKPLWRFLIQPGPGMLCGVDMDEKQYGLRYKVELDARTGDIIQQEAFEFTTLDHTDLDYLLKWF
ncbi:MAG: hypothetical protein FWF47_04970 [Clostridia bacterium]|nr:hypothetical protein [Clostridia bacterium]